MLQRIAFTASPSDAAQEGLAALVKRYGQCEFNNAEVIVALGGDGFMLQTLHATNEFKAPVYGMNRGTVGFLMNEFSLENLTDRLVEAEEAVINPLRMHATCADGITHTELAINEVSLLRQGPQAAKLKMMLDVLDSRPELKKRVY